MTPLRPSIFRSRFFWNLYLTYALLVVATSAAIGFIVDRQMEAALLADVETSLRDKTVLLSTYAAQMFAARGNYSLSRLGAESRSRVTMILGGMLIPLELFPEGWQPILKILPFSSMVYGPAHLFVQPDLAFLGDLLGRQAVAIVVFALLITIVYRAAIKRINTNGG